jgi:hypothetical protein
MTNEAAPALPHITRWSAERARVVGSEIWDEYAGRRLEQPAPGARVLWRVEIADALEAEGLSDDEPGSQPLLDLLAELHKQGSLDEQEFARARVLHDAFEQADVERRARQAARSADAPRVYLSEDAGALLAPLFVQVTKALGTTSEEGSQPAEAMRSLREKLDAETSSRSRLSRPRCASVIARSQRAREGPRRRRRVSQRRDRLSGRCAGDPDRGNAITSAGWHGAGGAYAAVCSGGGSSVTGRGVRAEFTEAPSSVGSISAVRHGKRVSESRVAGHLLAVDRRPPDRCGKRVSGGRRLLACRG